MDIHQQLEETWAGRFGFTLRPSRCGVEDASYSYRTSVRLKNRTMEQRITVGTSASAAAYQVSHPAESGNGAIAYIGGGFLSNWQVEVIEFVDAGIWIVSS